MSGFEITVKNNVYDLKSKKESITISTTHNGYQWTSIDLKNSKELKQVYRTIGNYLNKEENCDGEKKN